MWTMDNAVISDCFATGNVSGNSALSWIGSLIGRAMGSGTFINNFYNEDATVTNNGTGGVNYNYADEATLEELAQITFDVYNRAGSAWVFSGSEPVWVMGGLPELILGG